jgi:predicted TIM-barrel fold metal-dependent hydrolase
MIVDGHCHAGRGDRLTAPWNTDAPLGAYLRRARAAGIVRTVVFPPFHGDYATANAELARIIRRNPGRLIGFAAVHARRDAGRVHELVGRAVRGWGFRGVKVHRLDAPATREVCEAARAFGVPLLYDVAGLAELLDVVAPQYADVTFIVPHLGSFADDWRAHQRLIDQLVRMPNVVADTSGVRRFDYLVQAARRAGPAKLLFGSDGPWLHPALELQKVRLLGLPPAQEALVLGGNLLRILRADRGAAVPAGPARAARR